MSPQPRRSAPCLAGQRDPVEATLGDTIRGPVRPAREPSDDDAAEPLAEQCLAVPHWRALAGARDEVAGAARGRWSPPGYGGASTA